MTDDEVMYHMRNRTRLNKVRAVFSDAVGRIEQAELQRMPPTAIERRRMEFDAVRRIAKELGVQI